MKVLLYGRLADVFGPEIDVSIETSCTVQSLRERLVSEGPAGGLWLRDRRVRAVVGGSFVSDSHRLEPDDLVEFLAPVSGG